jgi:type VI secretion system secreted protein VgrG
MASSSFTKKTTIAIDGKAIADFEGLTISQSLHTYHEFELTFLAKQVADCTALVGKPLRVTVAEEDGKGTPFEFNGIVAEAELVQRNLRAPAAVLRGYGRPYELDSVPGVSTYAELSASDIVTKCLGAYTGPKDVSPPAGPAHVLPFAVRYHETYWNFLRRLAYDYGAWLYYDGLKLHFTATPGSSPVELTYGLNLNRLRVGKRGAPKFVSQLDYFPLDSTEAASKSPANATFFAAVTENALPGPRQALTAADVGKFVVNRGNSYGADSSYVTGEAEVPGISIGTTVRISNPEGEGALGDFNVVEITHHIHPKEAYRNAFRAIPAAMKAMPVGRALTRPRAEPQLAEVTDNKDPRKLGRVQVRLLWMSATDKSPWLRVLTPHFGLDTKQAKNRGFLFVPEVKDQVMVGFQDGDPERPFVFGSMPHGLNVAVAEPVSKEHHISVNSGTTITFLDTDTKHELHLQVDDKNLITLVVDSGQGTITLAASKSIVLKATQEITLDAPTIKLTGTNVTITGSAKTAIAGAAVEIKADAELKAEGAMVKVAGKAMATMESSGMTVVKGSIVMIN